MLHLFSGNIRLEKVQKRFHQWAEKVCERFQIPMPLNSCGLATQPISFTEAWLSGFFQADGGFAAQYRIDKRYVVGYRIQLKAYLDQKSESGVLQEIAQLFEGTLQCRDKNKEYFRVQIETSTGFEYLRRYLTHYPLRGKKHIAQSRWFRIVGYLDLYQLPQPGTKRFHRFIRLVRNVNACQKKVEEEKS